ncbi:MipA/OmpV family protein [Massilia sp. PAMC28688]|uniref:MipA/OmpV family protein n=1 Tax=Massilia sp. PAMC28688 TaxID=2861283 RepID=UPI001C6262DA|nr:MipA/OmpV family protein [Massilia sp. PAMC28688]QYF94334.1 MipA/OmpV family protein [Massilia sp. PAMC28688]
MTATHIRRAFACCTAAWFAASVPAAAQQQLPLWELGAFGFAATTPAYPGASDRSTRGLLLPYFIYRGEVFRADQEGVGARLFRSDRVELDVGLAGSLPASSDDVEIREGMPDLGTLVEFGPRLKINVYRPSEASRVRLELPLRAVIELRGGARGQGYTFEPRLSYETRGEGARWTMDANLSLVAGDRKINGYFYDVAPAYATAARPAYDAAGGLMLVRVGLSGTRMISPDLRLFGFVRYESYAGAANRQSPLLRQEHGTSAGLGFTWTLKRSVARAR